MKKNKLPWEKERRYPKELLEPIDPEKLWERAIELAIAADDRSEDAVSDRFEELKTEEEERKLALLFDYYDLEPTDPEGWFALVMKLARHHVPGMKEKERSTAGAPPKWKGDEGLKLVKAVVHRMSKRKQLSVAAALREVAKTVPAWERMDPSTLRSRFDEAKRHHFRSLNFSEKMTLQDRERRHRISRRTKVSDGV